MSTDTPSGFDRIKNLAVRAVRVELRIYESLWRVIARRPKIPAGAHGFRYHRPVFTILIIFIALSAIEIPILDLLVHRWIPVRIGVLILGIWGLTWMIGLLCAYFSRPHTVGHDGIFVREGLEVEIAVPWAELDTVRWLPVTQESIDPTSTDKPGRVFTHDDTRVCAVWMGSETNIEIIFERSTVVRLPGLAPKGGTHEVDVLRFWVDEPTEFLAAVRSELVR